MAHRDSFRQTGAEFSGKAADAVYEAIRNRRDDVDKIARKTGFKPKNIQKIKDHLFYNVYLLDRYAEFGIAPEVSRFHSDTVMTKVWQRLTDGTHLLADLQLLRHGAAEAWYMRHHGPSYDAGHEAAQRRFPAPTYPEDE